MHIEVKENKIIVEFSQKEAAFIAQKLGKADPAALSNYIKEKLNKALSLQDIDMVSPSVGKDFNLDKIKKVSAELKKRTKNKEDVKSEESKTPIRSDLLADIAESDNEKLPLLDKKAEALAEDVGDELLADLLDKDLLKGGQKPPNKDEME